MKIVDEIIKYGKLIEKYNLISSHAGNISVRNGNDIFITKTGTMLGHLKSDDIIKVSLIDENDSNLQYASMETIVHKAIYKNSNLTSIIHSHPVYSIALSLVIDKFVPIDSEGKFILNNVPILKAKNSIASKEVASKIHHFFGNSKIAIIKGHGVFAAADSLEKAFYYTTVLENSSKIYYLAKLWISKL